MDIQLLNNKIDAAVQLIDLLEEVLISGIEITKEEIVNTLGNGVLSIFSEIVESYNLLQMQDIEEQTQFWMIQLDRNIDAIEKKDLFYLIDVLVVETKPAMLNFQKSLVKGQEVSNG